MNFTFSFRGVEGVITGLVDNTNNQVPTSVTVTASPTGTGLYSYYPWTLSGFGLSVVNGQIVSSPGNYNLLRSVTQANYPDYSGTYGGQTGDNDGYGFDLVLGDPGVGSYPETGWSLFCLSNVACYDSTPGVMTYTPAPASVPAPLPLLGVLPVLRINRFRTWYRSQFDNASRT